MSMPKMDLQLQVQLRTFTGFPILIPFRSKGYAPLWGCKDRSFFRKQIWFLFFCSRVFGGFSCKKSRNLL